MPEMLETYVIEDPWTRYTYRVRLWALCRSCGRAKEFAAYDLINQSRDSDRKLYEVARLPKCKFCGRHKTVLVPGVVDPEQARKPLPR
jgi:hypothetical protein